MFGYPEDSRRTNRQGEGLKYRSQTIELVQRIYMRLSGQGTISEICECTVTQELAEIRTQEIPWKLYLAQPHFNLEQE